MHTGLAFILFCFCVSLNFVRAKFYGNFLGAFLRSKLRTCTCKLDVFCKYFHQYSLKPITFSVLRSIYVVMRLMLFVTTVFLLVRQLIFEQWLNKQVTTVKLSGLFNMRIFLIKIFNESISLISCIKYM